MPHPPFPKGFRPHPARGRAASLPRLRSAFTLIELLTVIAIIGILAAILIPTVGRVRSSARQAQATSNLRQLFVGHTLHAADDRRGFFARDNDDTTNVSWRMRIAPYLYPAIFPTQPTNGQVNTFRRRGPSVFDVPEARILAEPGAPDGQSIGINFKLTHWSYDGPPTKYSIATWPAPSRTILMGEMVDSNDGAFTSEDERVVGRLIPPAFRRGGGNRALMLFGDGHVAALTRQELLFHNNPSGQTPWCWW